MWESRSVPIFIQIKPFVVKLQRVFSFIRKLSKSRILRKFYKSLSISPLKLYFQHYKFYSFIAPTFFLKNKYIRKILTDKFVSIDCLKRELVRYKILKTIRSSILFLFQN